MWYIYIQWNTTQPLKKNEIMPSAATWMQLVIIILSEVSQTKTNIIYDLCMKSKKKKMMQMKLFKKQKQTHRHRKQIYGYQRRSGGGKY